MILPTMGNILIGRSCFKKYTVTLDLANNVVNFPDIALQLKSERGRYKIKMIDLQTTQKTVIQPDQQLIVPVLAERDIGTTHPTPETCDDPSKLTRIEKRTYDEITKLRGEEKIRPDSRRPAMQSFPCQLPMGQFDLRTN